MLRFRVCNVQSRVLYRVLKMRPTTIISLTAYRALSRRSTGEVTLVGLLTEGCWRMVMLMGMILGHAAPSLR